MWVDEQKKLLGHMLAADRGVADMSKTIKDVTDFMNKDVKEMNRLAEELHARALLIKEEFNAALAAANGKLAAAQKEIDDLRASL